MVSVISQHGDNLQYFPTYVYMFSFYMLVVNRAVNLLGTAFRYNDLIVFDVMLVFITHY